MTHRSFTYAGIGSRPKPGGGGKPGKPIPPAVIALASALASSLEQAGYTLRSGGATGMDTAFESGLRSMAKEIYLPWKLFNHHWSERVLESLPSKYWHDLQKIAQEHHPAWYNVSPKAGLLLMRNGQQILGHFLNNPADFVLCWTWDGKDSGGTGQALRIARSYGVPVFNLGNADDLELLHQTHVWSRKAIEQFRLAA